MADLILLEFSRILKKLYLSKGGKIMNILIYPIIFLYAIAGAGSTLFITGYLFVVLAQKIARKIKYGASLYD